MGGHLGPPGTHVMKSSILGRLRITRPGPFLHKEKRLRVHCIKYSCVSILQQKKGKLQSGKLQPVQSGGGWPPSREG